MSIGDSNYGSPQQSRRQIEIASHLRRRILSFTNGDITLEEFQFSCRTEAQSLALAMVDNIQAEFLLKSIANGIVSVTAEYTIPRWAIPFMSVFTNDLFNIAKNMKVVHDLEREIRKAVEAMDVSTNFHETNFSAGCNPPTQESSDVDGLLLHLAVPRMLQLVWKFNAHDITHTLREACKRVLDDSAGDQVLRMTRAKALNVLGREFYAAIRIRQDVYGKKSGMFPNQDEIQETVKMALMESIVSESKD